MNNMFNRIFRPVIVSLAMVSVIPTAALAATFSSFSQPPAVPVVLPTRDNVTLLRTAPNTSAYRTFSYNGYSFEIPRTWTWTIQDADLTNGNQKIADVSFKNAQGKDAANLMCPPLPVGLGGMDIRTQSRKLIKNSFLYEIGLIVGMPEGEKTSKFAFVDMTHAGYQTKGDWYTDPGFGCELRMDTTKNLETAAQHIYQSVKVEDWKTGSGAGLTFRYPSAWSLEVMDSDSPWGRKLFRDVNGREIAALDCPIPGQGFVEWDLSVWEKRLARPQGKYDIKWLFGSSTDELNKVTNHLQHLGWSRPEPKSENVDHGEYACRLISTVDGQKGIFREIYKSLK